MKKWMSLLAVLTFMFALYLNYLAGTGAINDLTIADISEKYPTLVTPTGFTFSIWGIIYLGLTAFSIYQLKPWWSRVETQGVHSIRLLFIGTNVLNGVWVLAWLNDQTGLAMLLMILLFLHLFVILMNVKKVGIKMSYRWMVAIPFQIYAGWITVALIANVSIFMKKNGFQDLTPVGENIWAIGILVIALAIYYKVMKWRNFPVFGLTGSWATAGIAVAQWNVQYEVGWTAAIVSLLLLIISITRMVRN